MTGDGIPEMLFMGEHILVGEYYSEIIIAQKIDGEYVYMDLPQSVNKEGSVGDVYRYEMGYDIYVLEVGEDTAIIGNRDAGIEIEAAIPEGKQKNYKSSMRDKDTYGSSALMADIVDNGDSKEVKLWIPYMSRYNEVEGMFIEVYVRYEDGKWIARDAETKGLEEVDWWWWISD